MTNNKYPSCEIAGGGKVFLKDTKNGEKFKIIRMSAENIEIKTSMQLEVGTLVDLKIILNSILFEMDINAKGKVVGKLEPTEKYRIQFIDLSDKAKKEIDEIMRNACDIC
ncbi:hypothetical protein [Clostridium sp.]|uniref:hypothetical protein n=1 Tax=Clostridium sp. TaxID=1506 RepID=UPI00261821CE|nr:hypothetical protein [uncultured Clostridium sp.]